MSTKFYGEKKVSHVDDHGENHSDVVFSEGGFAKVSKKMLEVSLTKKPTDLTTLWDRQLSAVSVETLRLWLQWDVKMEQLDHLFNMLKTSIEYNNAKAADIVWGAKLKDRVLSNVDDILKKDRAEREAKEAIKNGKG